MPKTRHRYTKVERAWLEANSYGRHREETAREFIEVFGLDLKIESVIAYMKRHGIKCGIDMRFRPGCVSHNKGVPVTKEQYDRLHPTMWKPGSKPPNTDPIGTEKVLSDGYVWVKINDIPKAKKNVNWRQKHRLIYEQYYGPIPPGARVVFIDKNKRNFNIENLRCISNGELGVMNRHGLWTENPQLTETGLAIAKLTMLSKQRQAELDRSK